MSSDPAPPSPQQRRMAESLADETGVTEQQALMLVQTLGFSRPSLVFAARSLKRESRL